MTDLEDHAKSGDGPEIVLVSDLPQRPAAQILDDVLTDHDDLTDEDQFPQHGKFLRVERPDGQVEYWECPSSLAQEVVEAVAGLEIETEDAVLDVQQVAKAPSGEWRYTVQVTEAGDAA